MSPPPTAATPEELAAQTAASLFDGTILTEKRLADIIAAAISQHSEPLRAEIERLTKERDDWRQRWSDHGNEMAAIIAKRDEHLSASLDRERGMREALTKPGVILFLDGRNEHGTHVLPMPMQTADITTNGDDLHEDAEAITQAAEAAGYPVGSGVWCEFRKVKGQYDDLGQCEMEPGWEFVGINLTMTEMFGWHADAALKQQETADVR